MLEQIAEEFNVKIMWKGCVPKEFYVSQFEKLRTIKDEFPWITNIISVIKEKPNMNRSIMNVQPTNTTKKVEIHVSIPQCKNSKKLEEEYNIGVKSRWHPQNSTYNDTLIHEIGHAFTYILTPPKRNGKFNHSKWLEIENTIIKECIETLENTYLLEKKSQKNWRNTVSRYAGTNNSECIAESFVDYIANGKNCSDLAKEIVKNIKDRLHKVNPIN